MTSSFSSLLEKHRPDLRSYEKLYKHFHSNPELSNQETQTAARIAEHLRQLSPDLEIKEHIGGHGIVAIFRNGPGKVVLLRADMDALPIKEKTGLPYASDRTMEDTDGDVKPVMHACGHDFHITSLLAAADTLLNAREAFSGTILFVFQPSEEKGSGAQAMIDDGLYDPKRHGVPIPNLCLGQHVFPTLAGTVETKAGTVMSAANSFKITIYGRGGHGSSPHLAIDPVLIASYIVVRLQTIISRETPPNETNVLTIGAIQAGSTENIIADEAVLRLNLRSVNPKTRDYMVSAIHRIVNAECAASRCPKPPSIEPTTSFPLTSNDDDIVKAVQKSFTSYFGDRHNSKGQASMASEDFGTLGSAVGKPVMFWFFGGYEREVMESGEVPFNHNARFAPALQPTLGTGVDALVVAALTFVGSG